MRLGVVLLHYLLKELRRREGEPPLDMALHETRSEGSGRGKTSLGTTRHRLSAFGCRKPSSSNAAKSCVLRLHGIQAPETFSGGIWEKGSTLSGSWPADFWAMNSVRESMDRQRRRRRREGGGAARLSGGAGCPTAVLELSGGVGKSVKRGVNEEKDNDARYL